ncbi:hypothetical protein K0M31_014470 [Melipona bicolor]|uniref:Uncharacterized protein n=1 Tax=Melipona bicolor TaxID=60889 RepID=A0AA40KUC0_9HYME|nr:hypothetical protein K0M31_014470 [Melipona bicolor]
MSTLALRDYSKILNREAANVPLKQMARGHWFGYFKGPSLLMRREPSLPVNRGPPVRMELNAELAEETRGETRSGRFHGHGIGLESAFLRLRFHTSPVARMLCHVHAEARTTRTDSNMLKPPDVYLENQGCHENQRLLVNFDAEKQRAAIAINPFVTIAIVLFRNKALSKCWTRKLEKDSISKRFDRSLHFWREVSFNGGALIVAKVLSYV